MWDEYSPSIGSARRSNLRRERFLLDNSSTINQQSIYSCIVLKKWIIHARDRFTRGSLIAMRHLLMASRAQLAALATAASSLLVARCVVGGLFGHHVCRTVFNRAPPPLWRWLRPFLKVTRPLELAWRLLTAPLRVARPDVMILGEVRCGTTTLASLLRSQLGMRGPFTPWDVPLANEKESFFFAGHYFGCVAPRLYKLCFPLRALRCVDAVVRRWLRLAPPPLLFDGCASHLSAPWAPCLVEQLLREKSTDESRPPQMVFVVCVREPVAQHLSWWRLEQGSMAFAEACGFGAKYLAERHRYPPCSLEEAFELSCSPEVRNMYAAAETFAEKLCASDQNPSLRASVLPDWALPFPNGQLSAFERFGCYAASLERWFARFGRGTFVVVSLE